MHICCCWQCDACTLRPHLALEGPCHLQEDFLLANGVGAKQEQSALVVEALSPHSIHDKAQHLWPAEGVATCCIRLLDMPSVLHCKHTRGCGRASQASSAPTRGQSAAPAASKRVMKVAGVSIDDMLLPCWLTQPQRWGKHMGHGASLSTHDKA